jgi:hypothetical protein
MYSLNFFTTVTPCPGPLPPFWAGFVTISGGVCTLVSTVGNSLVAWRLKLFDFLVLENGMELAVITTIIASTYWRVTCELPVR